jgi:paraquat-inducible protein B
MGRKANPAIIGAFVLGAVALAVAGILIFGSGQLFKHTSEYVCFFPGTVDGLAVGAPVRMKGVEIGTVSDIRLRLPEQTVPLYKEGIFRIPVTIKVDTDKLIAAGALVVHPNLEDLIERGLRAQLSAQSFVTGLLFVQLDFFPDSPVTLVLPAGPKSREIPTLPTAIEQVRSAAENLFRRLEQVHVEDLVKSLTQTVDAIRGVVTTPELRQAIQALPATVASINQTLTSIREMKANLDAKAGPLLDSLKETSEKGGAALDQARSTLQTVQGAVEPDSPLSTQLSGSLQEVSDAARALRLLATYLERNPSAIVRGKDVASQ